MFLFEDNGVLLLQRFNPSLITVRPYINYGLILQIVGLMLHESWFDVTVVAVRCYMSYGSTLQIVGLMLHQLRFDLTNCKIDVT